MRGIAAVILATSAVACTKPVAPPAPDPKLKHEAVYRAQKQIEGSIAVGLTYLKLGELLQDLSTELLIASDRATDQADRDLLGLYRDCLQTYADSALIWKHKIDGEKYDWMGGETYQVPELVPLVEKYKLTTQARKVPYTKQDWTAITGDPLLTIWASSGATCGKATKAFLALAAPAPSK